MDTGIFFQEKSMWRMINTGILVCIGLCCGSRWLGISSVGFRIILTALIMMFILLFMNCVTMRGRLLGIAGITAALFGVGIVAGFHNCMLFMKSYIRWFGDRPQWQEEWAAGYEMIQTIVIVLACSLLEMIIEKNFRFKLLGAAALFGGMAYALLTQKALSKAGVVFIMCYILLTYVEWTQIYWNKEKGKSIQAYMLWIMPFFAVYFVCMMFLKVPDEPYDWQIVKNAYQQIRESLVKVSQNIIKIGDEDYDMSLSGFSDRGDIGSGLWADDREIMRIYDDSGLVSHVYLSGKVYDTFDGRQWKQRNNDVSKERYIDGVETMYAVRRYADSFYGDYMRYADIKIRYQYFRSEYLFTPLKPLNMIQDGESLDFRESGGSLFFDKAKGYGAEYEVSYLRLNAGQDAFDRFLEDAANLEPKEKMLETFFQDVKQRTGLRFSDEDLEKHRQEVIDHYTQKIEVSDEVEQYIDRITAGAQTDVEKLRAFEKELSSYTYTLTPGELPDEITNSADFLDYFLLESRQGYCSHFATAFALLAGREGLPVRYVQGFCVPLRDSGETVVYSYMSHAWPEVYLEEIGWIPFEPTPGYEQMRYVPWEIQGQKEEMADQSSGQSLSAESVKESAADTSSVENGEMPEESDAVVYRLYDLLQLLKMTGVILLLMAGAGIAVYVLSRVVGNYRYSRMSEDEKFRMEVHRSLRILSLMGIRRQEETLEEFRKRVEPMLPQKDLLQFINSYEGFLYGDREVDLPALEEIKRQQQNLALLLKEMRRWAYLYYLFF